MTFAMCRPLWPALEYDTDFASSNARFNASTVLMSGRGAPASTQAPTPAVARSVRDFAFGGQRIDGAGGGNDEIRRSTPAHDFQRVIGGAEIHCRLDATFALERRQAMQ
jgi:hypothetical protein